MALPKEFYIKNKNEQTSHPLDFNKPATNGRAENLKTHKVIILICTLQVLSSLYDVIM